jgi:hypothetical protein
MKMKKEVEKQLLEERQKKNEARIKKQEEFKIFKGRQDVKRSKKIDQKP